MSVSSNEADYLRFRQTRHRYVTSPKGPLALTGTTLISAPRSISGVNGIWMPAADGQPGLIVDAFPDDGIRVDGLLVDGSEFVAGEGAVQPASIEFDDGTLGTIIAQPDGLYALRIWDANNKKADAFDLIDSWKFDPAFIVDARFTPSVDARTVDIGRTRNPDTATAETVVGEVRFSFDGAEHTAVAFDGGARLHIVFRDATSGDTSYGMGRFLFVPVPTGEPDADGSYPITLDFNRAIIPPCGFSDFFNCPMPPAQNRYTFAVTAGEKLVLSVD